MELLHSSKHKNHLVMTLEEAATLQEKLAVMIAKCIRTAHSASDVVPIIVDEVVPGTLSLEIQP